MDGGKGMPSTELTVYPGHDEGDDIMLLSGGEGCAGVNMMPFFQAVPAAGASCMLGNEDWVSFHRCLATVIRNEGRGKP